MATRFKPLYNPYDMTKPTVTGTAAPKVDDDPALDPNADPNATPTPPPGPGTFDPNDPTNQTTGQGINEKVDPVTKPTEWWQSATGLFEGPQNSWGMDTTQPDLAGFPQWDTATSLKYRFGREVAKYAPTAENAQKVIQDAQANGWDIRPDDKDQTMFWFHHENGEWEPVRLLSGSNTWEFNWGSNATGGNSQGATGGASPTTGTDLGPFQPAQTGGVSGAPGSGSVTYDGPGYQAPGTTTAQSGQDSAIQTQMRDALLKLLNQPEVNAESLQNDPAVRAQRIQAQRAEERQRGQLAEQNAYEGYADSGAEQTDLAGLRQERSESEATFIGQLAIQQMQARREDIRAAIQIATQQGQFALGQQLARELAALNAALTREEITARMGDNAAARALQERLSNNQLTQQDRQFLLSLGFNYDQLEVNGNANAANALF